MKKLLGIIVFSLLLSGNGYAEELYLRCIPKVQDVREGYMVRKGATLFHRVLFVEFASEFDLTKSEEPIKSIKRFKTYLINEKGKKDKTNFGNATYTEKQKIQNFEFEDFFEGKKFKFYSTMNINFDGGSWVSSGIYNSTTVEGNNLVKSNFTWFGKCFELTKKQFKKPLNNGMFEIEKS